MRTSKIVAAAGFALAAGLAAAPLSANAATTNVSSHFVDMYRLFNPYTTEHLYTSSASERDGLAKIGWHYEGVGWVAPSKVDADETFAEPVYRLYNPYTGDHHYTKSAGERDSLAKAGWRAEGIGWYSLVPTWDSPLKDDARTIGVGVYRQFNPYVQMGTHNYTTSKAENDAIVKLGWRAEGVAWEAVNAGSTTNGTDASHKAALSHVKDTDQRSWEALAEGIGAVSPNQLADNLVMANGITVEDANWAVEHSGIDWKARSLKYVAKQLARPEGRSEAYLRDLLKRGGYTSEVVDYAIANSRADWNAQAVKAVRDYRSYMGGITKDEARAYLTGEAGFTKAQADYAVAHADITWK